MLLLYIYEYVEDSHALGFEYNNNSYDMYSTRPHEITEYCIKEYEDSLKDNYGFKKVIK